MSYSLPLLRRSITLKEALDDDDDILQELSYPDKRLEFYYYLLQHRKQIEDIVSFHLGVPNEVCKVAAELKEWVHGSFNVCIPVYIDNSAGFSVKKVFIRFPLPYKVGESQYPGNAEEKLRCEVATYIWIQNHCPDVPIPCLRGFGFSSGWSVCDWSCTLLFPLLERMLTRLHPVYSPRKYTYLCPDRMVFPMDSIMVIRPPDSFSIHRPPIAP